MDGSRRGWASPGPFETRNGNYYPPERFRSHLSGASGAVWKRGAATPLHGRSPALAQISAAFDAAERGEARVVVVSGPPGVGKTAVLQAAIHRARGRGFRIASGRSRPRDTPIPFDLIRDLLHPESTDEASSIAMQSLYGLPRWLVAGDQASMVSGFPAVAVLPDEPVPVEKLILRLLDLVRSLIELGRRLLYLQLERVLLGEFAARPVLIAVDDLQYADRDSLEFLRFLAGGPGSQRVILLATIDSHATAAGTRGNLVEALVNAPSTKLIALTGLSLGETDAVLREIDSDPSPSPDYVRAIHELSKGIPAALERLARRYHGTIPPPRAAEDRTGSGTFPGGLPENPPEELLRLLTAAAVIGRQFDLPVLARTVRRRALETLETMLEPLVESGALRRAGVRRYEFASPSVRQELYGRLAEDRRQSLHRSVARALEVGARPTGPELFEAAYHYHLASEPVASIDYNRRAADVATREFAYDDARLYLERALDSLGRVSERHPETARSVRVALAHVLCRIGKVEEAKQVLDVLRGSIPSPLPAASPLERMFAPEIRPDLWAHAESARAAAERSIKAFRAQGSPRWLAVAHRALGVAAWSLGDPTAAEEHHHAAAELARLAGDARLEGQSLLDRAHLVRLLDPNGLAVSRRLLTDAIERFTASGDVEWLARAYIDRSAVLRTLGRLPDALNDLTSAADQASRSRSPALETWVELRTARVLVEEGRTGRARKSLERLRRLLESTPRREVEQQISLISGMLQEREGRLDRARAHYESSLSLATEAGALEEAADSHRRLADLDTKLGRNDDARRHLDEAERLAPDVARQVRIPPGV